MRAGPKHAGSVLGGEEPGLSLVAHFCVFQGFAIAVGVSCELGMVLAWLQCPSLRLLVPSTPRPGCSWVQSNPHSDRLSLSSR